jgi:hypothetical protein
MQASYYNLAPDDHCFYFNAGCVEEHSRVRKMPAKLLEKMKDRELAFLVTNLLQNYYRFVTVF